MTLFMPLCARCRAEKSPLMVRSPVLAGRCSAQMVGFALASLASYRERENFEEVPWQRIINAKGKISPHGFGMGGFIQRQLLEEEDIQFDSNGVIDLDRFGWDGVLTTPVRDRKDLI